VSTDVANVDEFIVEEEKMATDISSDETLFKVREREIGRVRKQLK